MIKDKLFWVVVIGEALVCFAVWRRIPQAKIRLGDLFGWGSAAFLAALVLAMFSDSRKWKIVVGAIVAPLVATVANIGVGLASNSLSHSIPFQLFMTFMLATCGALIGAVIGTGLHRKGRRSIAS